MANEGLKREQRETFPIINKAIAPSILMRQGEKTQWPGCRYTIGYNGGLAFLLKARNERHTEGEKPCRLGNSSKSPPLLPPIESHPTVQPQLYAKGRGHCGPLLARTRRRVRCKTRAPTSSGYFGIIRGKPVSWGITQLSMHEGAPQGTLYLIH